MHSVVKEHLERRLAGALEPADRREIEAHLGVCKACRDEVREFEEISRLVGSLRSEDVWEPSPGFYGAVMQRVGQQRAKPAFASLFTLDFAFGRRLVLASLMTLAVLGGYLVSHEAGTTQGPFPVTVIAEQESPSFDSASGPEAMLATLTAYVR